MFSVVLAMVILGCGKSNDERIVDLEKRMSTLEGRLATMERQMFEQTVRNPQRWADKQRTADAVSRVPLTPEQISERQRMREEVRKRLEERREKARAKKKAAEAPKTSAKND